MIRHCAWGASSAPGGSNWFNLRKLYELRPVKRESGQAISGLQTRDAGRGLHAGKLPRTMAFAKQPEELPYVMGPVCQAFEKQWGTQRRKRERGRR